MKTPKKASRKGEKHKVNPKLVTARTQKQLTSSTDQLVVISQDQRDALLLQGIPIGSAINGPNDGLPKYMIPVKLLRSHPSIIAKC